MALREKTRPQQLSDGTGDVQPGAYAHAGPEGRRVSNAFSVTADDDGDADGVCEDCCLTGASMKWHDACKSASKVDSKEDVGLFDLLDEDEELHRLEDQDVPPKGKICETESDPTCRTSTLSVENSNISDCGNSPFWLSQLMHWMGSPNEQNGCREISRGIAATRAQREGRRGSDLVNAQMVNEAEAIFYAEQVEQEGFLQRNPAVVASIGCLVLAALISLVVILTRQGSTDGIPKEIDLATLYPNRTRDERCWVDIDTLPVRMQCYCTNTTEYTVAKMPESHLGVYRFVSHVLEQKSVIGSGDEIDTLFDRDNMLSCDPVNLVMLMIATSPSAASLDSRINAPQHLIVDFFVFLYIYVTMGGRDWTQTAGWNGDTTVGFCEWHGLGCMFLQTFADFALPANGLRGTIPSVIRHLKTIRYLDFSNNPGITGTIPSEVAGMTSLRSLDLSGCSLSGTIPTELGSLDRLDSLNLNKNQLTGTIPSELFVDSETGDGSHLRFLNLASNQLNGTLPREIGRAERFTMLNLQSNHLTGSLPSELGALSFLELFNIAVNKFAGSVPHFLGQMPRLSMINFFKSGLEEPLSRDQDADQYNGNATAAVDVMGNTVMTYIPETFCPLQAHGIIANSTTMASPTLLVDSRTIVIECNATTLGDCSCCARQDSLASTGAFVQLACAETLNAFAVGLND